MSLYRHILVALEADEEAHRLLAHGKQLAEKFSAALSAVHVVEPVAADLGGDVGVVPTNISVELSEQSRKLLLPICASHGLIPDQLQILVGPISSSIRDAADDAGADLIVIGHHRHRGLAALFGHTDKGVVGKTHCDVLVVALQAT
ncbi:MAG: universal stress protein [Stagnimonas sp.]|nr:universal stress protein [Stagnimonas sp.]